MTTPLDQMSASQDRLTDFFADHLAGTFHCTRVWEAWTVGTMSQSDFEDVGESDTPEELAALIQALFITPLLAAIAAKDARIAELEAWQAAITSRAAGWISVDDEMPEPGQNVAFVVKSPSHLDGRVLGGRFLLGQGFSVPGLTVDATHWQPLPAPPTPQDPPTVPETPQ